MVAASRDSCVRGALLAADDLEAAPPSPGGKRPVVIAIGT
jgi:hypothetical protein